MLIMYNYSTASLKRQEYHVLHLVFLQIGGYKRIYSPSVPDSSTTIESPLLVNAGTFSRS